LCNALRLALLGSLAIWRTPPYKPDEAHIANMIEEAMDVGYIRIAPA
jgi:hypothetical protein